MKKLLIIGVSGLTGFKLANLSSGNYQVFGTYNHRSISIENCETFQLDKSNKKQTTSLLEKINPDVVVDCSALHNVDYCEKNQEETWKVNVEAPKYIAEKCKEISARMIYMSTDYVYDGTETKYNEKSQPNPLNYYGLSKLKGEQEIANLDIDYAICRTSLIFGWNPGEVQGKKSSSGKTMNYVIWALNKLRNGEELTIVNDQYSTPTYADNLAESILKLANTNLHGIFHSAGKNCVNRFDFTLKIAEIFGINQNLILPTTSDKFTQVAKRPMRCCLDVSKAEKLLNMKFLTIEQALVNMKDQEMNFN